jgi:hypothetical protein
LKFSDKRNLGYSPSSTGIPQAEIGEMSSLIANFYISSFDAVFRQKLLDIFKDASKFEFFRYSDDMWIGFNGAKELAYKIIQDASFELGRIKLHINEKKILILDQEAYKEYWRFRDWDDIDSYITQKKYEALIEKYKELVSSFEDDKNISRALTLARYILKYMLSNKDFEYYFTSKPIEQKYLISSIVRFPKLSENLEFQQKFSIAKIVRSDNELKLFLKSHLKSKENIYPNIEYLILEILSLSIEKNELLDFVNNYLSCESSYQWYSRCICLRILTDQLFSPTKKTSATNPLREELAAKILDEVVSKIKELEPYQSFRERRYSIYFLYHLDTSSAKECLERNFNHQDDLMMISFLKKNLYLS